MSSQVETATFLGHPRGLVVLFFTELWERFSYYGMRALLVLYIVALPAQGGLGFSTKMAATIYGIYTMSVYMSSIPGGFIADRILGARRAIFIGGLIIACGHFCLAFPPLFSFYLGLILIVCGTGLLKPNISSLLGSLYPEGDERRDGGFSIFYMGINIGAMLAPFVCGYLAQSESFKAVLVSMGLPPHTSWHWGFAAAGVGMLIGLAHFVAQKQLLGQAGGKPVKAAATVVSPLPAPKLTQDEFKRLGAIAILFIFNMLFWSVYEQGGSSLNLFADKLTRNEIFGWHYPSSWFQAVDPIFVILLAPVASWLWLKLGHKQPSSPAKFIFGMVFLGLGIALAVPATMLSVAGKVSPLWLMGVYFLEVVGELCLSPVGLSTVTKLAPKRFVGITMGVWFVSASLGNLLAGWLAGFFDATNAGALVNLFGGMAVACFAAALVLALLTPTIRKLMVGVK